MRPLLYPVTSACYNGLRFSLLVGMWFVARIIIIFLCFRGKKRIFAPPKGAYIIYKVYSDVWNMDLEG